MSAGPTVLEFARQISARGKLRRAALFYLNVMRAGKATAEGWLRYVQTDLAALTDGLRFALCQKPFRPYLRRRFTASRRMEILREHYQLLTKHFKIDALKQLLEQPGMKLATLIGKSGATFSFYWGLSTTKEGEIDFFFWDDKLNAPLAILTGVFTELDGKRVFYIGGLRGIKPPLGKPEIVAATRELYALRPKHAVLQGTCAAARTIGAEILIAPTQANHITRNFGFASREILADYDAFWQEFTETRMADGDYAVPVQLPRRLPEEVKSKKRTEWTRRMAQLDALADQVAASLQQSGK